MIFDLPTWPLYSDDEIDAVTRVLRSGKVNQWTGPEVNQFQAQFAAYIGSKHGIAVANGTSSLELILKAWNVGEGDEVIVTPRSFLASASAVAWVGATPVFADVDEDTQALSAETVAPVLTSRTKAILVVHLAGCPADMGPIMDLARAHNLLVLEDCAQAHGAEVDGVKVGAIGDAGSFSFCQDKIMSLGGEGGLVTTDDDEVFRRVWELKDHGKSREAVFEREHPPGFRWLHESLGTNLRMTGMQAAIGIEQLKKLDGWIAQRTANAQILTDALQDIPAVRIPKVATNVRHAWYKYYFFVRPERLRSGWTRDRILHEMEAAGIPGLSGSCSEMYLEKVFQSHNLNPPSALPVARALGETSVMMLVDPAHTEERMHRNGKVVRNILLRAHLD